MLGNVNGAIEGLPDTVLVAERGIVKLSVAGTLTSEELFTVAVVEVLVMVPFVTIPEACSVGPTKVVLPKNVLTMTERVIVKLPVAGTLVSR